jgi:methionyl-tRNA formyltransferase
MRMATEHARSLTIIYFGATGAFSLPPLQALLDAGLRVRAAVLPALGGSGSVGAASLPIIRRPAVTQERSQRPMLPLLTPFRDRSIVSLAAEREIPVFEVARLADPLTLATLGAIAPDVICVACFPRRLPRALLALPRLGCLNTHPSLLPDNRGPDPLFWTFFRGDRETGVTIHQMDSGLDTGPILAQERVNVAEGMSEAALERELATRGGALLVRALGELAAGTARPAPQDESRATVYPWPTSADFVITPDWSAQQAYVLACGVRGRPQPLLIQAPGTMFVLLEPLSYDATAQLGSAWRLDGDALSLQCSPGVLRARVAPIRNERASFVTES